MSLPATLTLTLTDLLFDMCVLVENDFQYPHHSPTRAQKKKLGKPQFMVRAMCKSWRDAGNVQILAHDTWGFRFVSSGFRLH
jgi:hypothetical protein